MSRTYPALDLAKFNELLAEAAECYNKDLIYGVNIVKVANSIQSKRDTWALRLQYRELAGGPVPWAEGWPIADALEVLRANDNRSDTG